MQFIPTILPGVHVVEVEARTDERGLFGRTWCADEARAHGLCPHFAQCSVSFNRIRGTLRGLHFQTAPHAETKLVRCTAGAIVDVVVDLRPGSPTFRRWVAEELTAENRRALYIPEGCAHGFQTLTDGAEVFYQITPAYQPGFSSGVRWDDPAFGIRWPDVPCALSERDRTWPDFAA
jgi:dTDP-4-dehydrorhamnose 3,5-epimerase